MEWVIVGCVFVAALITAGCLVRARQLRVNNEEASALRATCLSIIHDRGPSTSIDDEGRVNNQSSLDHLRLYARFLRQYSTVDLDVFLSCLRLARSNGITKLTPSDIMDEHLAAYGQFRLLSEAEDFFTFEHLRTKLILPAMLAVSDLENAPLILGIVRDREIYDEKMIRSLVREMKSNGAPALAEGML